MPGARAVSPSKTAAARRRWMTPARSAAGAAFVWQVYARRVLAGGRGPEGRREDLEEVIAGVPVADRRGPVERVGVLRVGQDVPVEHPDHYAIPVIGEFPVRGLFRLRKADLAEQDEVISGIAGLAIRRLLPPVRERIRLGLIGLVDQQEYAAVRGVPDIYVVAVMRDLPAARDADRETSRVGKAVIPGGERGRSAARRGAARRGGRGRAGRRRRGRRGDGGGREPRSRRGRLPGGRLAGM